MFRFAWCMSTTMVPVGYVLSPTFTSLVVSFTSTPLWMRKSTVFAAAERLFCWSASIGMT